MWKQRCELIPFLLLPCLNCEPTTKTHQPPQLVVTDYDTCHQALGSGERNELNGITVYCVMTDTNMKVKQGHTVQGHSQDEKLVGYVTIY